MSARPPRARSGYRREPGCIAPAPQESSEPATQPNPEPCRSDSTRSPPTERPATPRAGPEPPQPHPREQRSRRETLQNTVPPSETRTLSGLSEKRQPATDRQQPASRDSRRIHTSPRSLSLYPRTNLPATASRSTAASLGFHSRTAPRFDGKVEKGKREKPGGYRRERRER